MKPLQSIALIMLVWQLGGCGLTPTQVDSPQAVTSWQAHRAAVDSLQRWQVSGRVALRMAQEGGQSSFVWQQGEASQRFELSGLLGVGALKLHSDRKGALLESGGERYRGTSPSQLLLQVTGWQIPVEAARHWIRGVPDPDAEVQALVLDPSNRLQQLQQSGWQVEIVRYQRVGELDLPEFVVLERGEVRLKLKLKQWQLQ